MAVKLGLVLGACLLSRAAALYSAQSPVSIQWDERNGKGDAFDSDFSLYPFKRVVSGDQPEQINLVYQSPTSVVVSWSSGAPQYLNAANASSYKAPDTTKQSIVQYAPQYGTQELNATGTPSYYTTIYQIPEPFSSLSYNYTSGLMNHVALTDLLPATQYYYRVGDGVNFSLPYTFKTLQAQSGNFTPYRIGVIADIGTTRNSTTTVQHLAESFPDVITLIGDFCYADNTLPNGTLSKSANYNGTQPVTYPPVWDYFYRWWGTLTSKVPFLAVNGNHEYEQDSLNVTFAAYNGRFNQTSDLSGSGNSRYYSVDLPGVHLISLSPYDNYNASSPQYTWLQKDLASVNKTKTPWLLVQFHTPVYNTYVSHYKEVECARIAWEPLFYQYGVDLVMHGHVHSYERTNRVYNYNLDPCGPSYLTIGDAGNNEQLAVPWSDTPGLCPAISLAASPGSKFQGNCQRYALFSGPNINQTNNGYCQTVQPSFSAYREPSFGHGTLDVSPDKLVWNWHRNQDAEPQVTDSYTYVPKDSSCPNAGTASPPVAAIPYGFCLLKLQVLQVQAFPQLYQLGDNLFNCKQAMCSVLSFAVLYAWK